jgi:hypothetical protein
MSTGRGGGSGLDTQRGVSMAIVADNEDPRVSRS